MVVAAVNSDDRIQARLRSNPSVGALTDIVSVRYSEAELERVHAEVLARFDGLRQGGLDITTIETDLVGNAVEVVVRNPPAGVAGALKAEFGDAIRVVASDVAVIGAACTSRSNCGSPYKAGLNIFKDNNTSPDCSAGFVMRSGTQTYYWTTAGHCSDLNQVWKHPSGTTAGYISLQGWTDNSKADIELLEIPVATASNQLFVSTTQIRSISSKQNPANEIIGETVCISAMNGNTCGALKSVNVSIPSLPRFGETPSRWE